MNRRYQRHGQSFGYLWLGGAKSGQFDKIYYDESTGKLVIIEAKGGGSPLGGKMVTHKANGQKINTPQKFQQGTKEYRDALIWNYKEQFKLAKKAVEKNEPGAISQVELDALEKTIDALERPDLEIDYYLVRQKVNTDGSLGDISVSKFD